MSFRRVWNCTFWELGFRQSSFRHITRAPQCAAPGTWARPLVQWHAVVPFLFRGQVSHRTQRSFSSNLSPLGGEYNRALSWRREVFQYMDEVDQYGDALASVTGLVLDLLDLMVVAVDEGDPGLLVVGVASVGFGEDLADHGGGVVDDAGGEPFPAGDRAWRGRGVGCL